MPIILNGDSGITTPSYGGTDTSEYLVPVTAFKNRLINSDMRIDQRNAGASITPTVDGTYSVDRWKLGLSQASKYSVQQNAGAVTPPAGFTNYLGFTSLSAYSVISSDYFLVSQGVEGFNTADLGWGTANAQTITVSFWVRSSLTGTFGGSIYNNAVNRNYVFSYTISAANTWEQKTITIAGDTTGTWATNNTNGLVFRFGLGAGTSQQGTAGSWGSSVVLAPTGAVNLVGTNGATFYITGVQLEKGSTATSFDYRPYGTELALCQRYYYRVDTGASLFTTQLRPDGYRMLIHPFKQTMRAAPTSTFTWNGDGSGVGAGGTTITSDVFQLFSASASAGSTTNPYLTALALNSEL